MIIFVEAKTKARVRSINKISDNTYRVTTPSVPEEGKANTDIIVILANFLDVPKSTIRLISGHSSKKKKFDVNT